MTHIQSINGQGRERKTITCEACHLGDHIVSEFGDPSDLDSSIHKGFTVGKGKIMWWYFIWHPSGHASIYREENNQLVRGYIKGDQMITIHFLEEQP